MAIDHEMTIELQITSSLIINRLQYFESACLCVIIMNLSVRDLNKNSLHNFDALSSNLRAFCCNFSLFLQLSCSYFLLLYNICMFLFFFALLLNCQTKRYQIFTQTSQKASRADRSEHRQTIRFLPYMECEKHRCERREKFYNFFFCYLLQICLPYAAHSYFFFLSTSSTTFDSKHSQPTPLQYCLRLQVCVYGFVVQL